MSNVIQIEGKDYVAAEEYSRVEADLKASAALVESGRMDVGRLQDELAAVEEFRKKKVEVEALKVKNEALKKNLMSVERREKARADAEIEKRAAEVESEIDNRVAAKTAEAAERMSTAEGRVAEAQRLVDEAKALEAGFESRVAGATKAFKDEVSATEKDALAKVIDAQRKAAQDILKTERFDRALHALRGVFNYIEKGKSLNPRDVLPTVRQIAGDALAADEKLVKDAEDAKRAAQIVAAAPEPEPELLSGEAEVASEDCEGHANQISYDVDHVSSADGKTCMACRCGEPGHALAAEDASYVAATVTLEKPEPSTEPAV